MLLGKLIKNLDHINWKELRKEYYSNQDHGAPAKIDVQKLKDPWMTKQNWRHSWHPIVVKYGFGDASGIGFRSSWEAPGGIGYRFGVRNEQSNKGHSSNYRELNNLVETVEGISKDEELAGTELFFFTINSTAERAYYNGTSSNRDLHDLVFRLRQLELNVGMKLHMCHIARKQMIDQVSDGPSRGNLLEGGIQGKPMSSFDPLHLSAVDHHQGIVDWIRSLAEIEEGKQALELLTPKDWFFRRHDQVSDDTSKNCDDIWTVLERKNLTALTTI